MFIKFLSRGDTGKRIVATSFWKGGRLKTKVKYILKFPIHLLLTATLLAGLHQTSSIAGQVVGWGRNVESQASPPAGLSNVIAVAAGGDVKSLALRSDGTVIAWGDWTNQPSDR